MCQPLPAPQPAPPTAGSTSISFPGIPLPPAWKRIARWNQARWREARDYPIGAHPYAGGDHATAMGSRLALDFTMKRHANFLTLPILEAVRAGYKTEPHQCCM
jgi:hypothetical protein